MAQNRLIVDQRSRIAEKIMELGNLVFIGLVVTQVISGPPFRVAPAAAGIICLLGAYGVSYWIMRGGGKILR